MENAKLIGFGVQSLLLEVQPGVSKKTIVYACHFVKEP